MYFITKGQITLTHKETSTMIRELKVDECFGEVGFFGADFRSVTALSRGFTETLILNRDSFLKDAQSMNDNMRSNTAYNLFVDKMKAVQDQKDLAVIGLKCYFC